jgi:hypothetical protein
MCVGNCAVVALLLVFICEGSVVDMLFSCLQLPLKKKNKNENTIRITDEFDFSEQVTK